MLTKQEGGLGLTNIIQWDRALKAQWVINALNSPRVANLADTQIGNQMGKEFWECQLVQKDIKKEFSQISEFYVFLVWNYFWWSTGSLPSQARNYLVQLKH